MHAISLDCLRNKALSLVMQFTDSASPKFMAPFQRANRFGAESRFVVTGVVETAPDFKTVGIQGKFFLHLNKLLPRSLRENHDLLNPHFVHVPDPRCDFCRSFC